MEEARELSLFLLLSIHDELGEVLNRRSSVFFIDHVISSHEVLVILELKSFMSIINLLLTVILAKGLQSATNHLTVKDSVLSLHLLDTLVEDLKLSLNTQRLSIDVEHKSEDMSQLNDINVLFNADLKNLHHNLLEEWSEVIEIIGHEELVLENVPDSFRFLRLKLLLGEENLLLKHGVELISSGMEVSELITGDVA